MTQIQEMLQSHPHNLVFDQGDLMACIEACFTCAAVCTQCADACLAEESVANLRECIRTDLDCADVCAATGRIMARQTQPNMSIVRAQLQACVIACMSCAESCEQHQDMHEHCRICAEACRDCQSACQKLLEGLT